MAATVPARAMTDNLDGNRERRRSSLFKFSLRPKKDKNSSRSNSVASQDDVPRRSLDSSSNRLRKNSKDAILILEQQRTSASARTSISSARPSQDFPVVTLADHVERSKQTGEIIDHTNMLHSLGMTDEKNDKPSFYRMLSHEGTEPGERLTSKLPPGAIDQIASYVSLADLASLALSCKAFSTLIGTAPWDALKLSENKEERLNFLARLDRILPKHLLCYDCGIYHVRSQLGLETLKPTNITNHVYDCPHVTNPQKIFPRIRLTSGRTLPFSFHQLVMRHHTHSPNHGIPVESISRRYRDKDSQWSHQTRYCVVDGHLLMRVQSQCFAPPGLPPAGERHLLYSREDFVPYFSVCPHWRDGVLMPNVKCALRHIPKPPEGSGVNRVATEVKLHFHPQRPIVVLCSECRPMRRCPDCPTEYLIEMKMAEDRSDPDKLFKQALMITRWSDLGDGSSPYTPEWKSLHGQGEYDSFGALGKRAVCGQFEAAMDTDVIPGQNMLSMNPDKQHLDEAGHNWY